MHPLKDQGMHSGPETLHGRHSNDLWVSLSIDKPGEDSVRQGFIGLGHLGKAIATRLIDCGHELGVYNRTAEKAKGMNAVPFDSPRDLAEHSDVIFICLTDSRAVMSLFDGPEGLVAIDICGKILVDFSTHQHSQVEKIYALAHQQGAHYMECPVLGSVVSARQGTLTLVAGGDAKAFEKVNSFLKSLSTSLFFLDKPGQATSIKLLNNMVLASLMISLSEALAFGESSGLDKAMILDILSQGAGGSIVLNAKKNKLLEEDFSAHFSNAMLFKDLTCAQDMAQDMGKILFSVNFAKQIYGRTFEKECEQDDFSGVYKLFKDEVPL